MVDRGVYGESTEPDSRRIPLPGKRPAVRSGGKGPHPRMWQGPAVLPSSIATTDFHTGGEPFRIVADPPVTS
jgi:hypothetical protein